MSLRIPIAITTGVVVTAALFFGMRSLIASREMMLDEYDRKKMVEFVRLRQDSRAETKKRELPNRQRPKPPPPTPDMDMPKSDAPGSNGVSVAAPSLDTGLDLGNSLKLGPAPADNDAVPVVRVEPMYPRRAAEQFIEGWVVLQFDITPTGSTKNVRVIDSKPARIFDRAAVQAVSKWKYNPKVIEGRSQVTRGVRVRLTFQLD